MSDITLQHSNGLDIEKLKQSMATPVATTTTTPKRTHRKRRKTPTYITSELISKVDDYVFRKGWTQARTGRHLSIGQTAMWRIVKQLRVKHERSRTNVSVSGEVEQLRAQLNSIKQGLRYLLETLG